MATNKNWTGELKIGDKVIGYKDDGSVLFKGVITHLGNINHATVKRDDGREGTGYEDDWKIIKQNRTYWSVQDGDYLKGWVVKNKITNWRSELNG